MCLKLKYIWQVSSKANIIVTFTKVWSGSRTLSNLLQWFFFSHLKTDVKSLIFFFIIITYLKITRGNCRATELEGLLSSHPAQCRNLNQSILNTLLLSPPVEDIKGDQVPSKCSWWFFFFPLNWILPSCYLNRIFHSKENRERSSIYPFQVFEEHYQLSFLKVLFLQCLFLGIHF